MSSNYQQVIEQARQKLAEQNPEELAAKSGVVYQWYRPLSLRSFVVPFIGQFYAVSWPEGMVKRYGTEEEASPSSSIIILHYLLMASGEEHRGQWVPFNKLWGGNSYFGAFKNRALDPLAEHFGYRPEEFPPAAEKLNGVKVPMGSYSYLVFALPRIPVVTVIGPGDKEIPPRATLLFDSGSNNYLETEDLAVLGEILALRLIHGPEASWYHS